MKVPSKYSVSCRRTMREMTRVTLSGYNKGEVMTKLMERLRFHDVDKANYWTAEMISSGQHEFLMNKLIAFACHEINVNNPKLPAYLSERIDTYKRLVRVLDIQDRNDQQVRNIFSEIVTVLSLSTKKATKFPKIGEVDFELEYIRSKIISKNRNLADQILRPEDPKDLLVPVNELATHIVLLRRHSADKLSLLTSTAGALNPYYWLAWLLEWDKHMTSRRLKDVEYHCASRTSRHYDDKFAKDVVWVIWDTLLRLTETFDDEATTVQVQALYTIFMTDYTRGKRTERKHVLYCAVQYLTCSPSWRLNVFIDRRKVIRAQCFVNLVYAYVNREGEAWEKTFRDNKISAYIEPAVHELDVDRESTTFDIPDVDECLELAAEVSTGGLYDAVKPKSHEPSIRSRTLTEYEERLKDYEPIKKMEKSSDDSFRNGLSHTMTLPAVKTDVERQHQSRDPGVQPRNVSLGRKDEKSRRIVDSLHKERPEETVKIYDPCPAGHLSIPVSCTKGVGCLYLKPTESIREIPRVYREGSDDEYLVLEVADEEAQTKAADKHAKSRSRHEEDEFGDRA